MAVHLAAREDVVRIRFHLGPKLIGGIIRVIHKSVKIRMAIPATLRTTGFLRPEGLMVNLTE
jgi:hypothetical protein